MRLPVVLALLVLLSASRATAQPARDVLTPRFEAGVGASVYKRSADAGAASAPGGGGAATWISRNLNRQLAIIGEAAIAGGFRSIVAGPAVSTGFYRDGATQSPGRFFAHLLVGAESMSSGARPVIEPGAGADVLLVPSHGVSLHWEIDYRVPLHSPVPASGARFLAGIVLGPHT